MSNKSGTSSQAVTLPEGGGTLHGIGETFSPDPFTGTGKSTVPLALPPGRNGFQPQLSLVYSTGNGNGPFGLGWELSVPAVSRKTAKGVPRYRDNATAAKERDTFILSGAEDLVPVSEPAPGVTRFRPRTEGTFARIERIRTTATDSWRVTGSDGIVSLYGAPLPPTGDPPVIADPAARTRIFAWKLSETSDLFGNRIEYRYRRDADTDGPHTWDQLYLEEIRYVDFEEGGRTRFLVSVRFVYEDRPDPFSEYRAGFEIRTRLRCNRIEIRTQADPHAAVLVRTYDLVYVDERVRAGEPPGASRPLNRLSLLSQLRLTGHDGTATQSLPPLEFGYTTFAPERQRFQPIRAVNDAMPTRSLADDNHETVGLFANGMPDIVQMTGSTARFWRNLGGGLFDAARPLTEVPAGVRLGDAEVQLADMNGNGRADLLVLRLNGYFPMSFQGRWSAQDFVRYANSPSVTFGDAELRLIDLDGDGVVDALRTGESFELFFNDPTRGFGLPELRSRRPIDEFPDLRFSDKRVKLGDLTGDGLQDFVLVDQGRIDYWPYMGHGRWGRRVTMEHSPVFQDAVPLPGGAFDPRRVLFGDVDGDGLDDIVYVEPGRLTLWINQGGQRWSDPIHIGDTPPFPDADAVRLLDVLGTGLQGVLWTSDQTGPGSHYKFLELTGGVKPYLLDRIDNHMGTTTRIEYGSSTDFHLADLRDPQTRWKTPLPFPVQVVKRIEVIDQISGGKLTTEYRYHHGYWDGGERELRGFGLVEQLDTETFDRFNQAGLHGEDAAFLRVEPARFSPPTLTRTWFHLGDTADDLHQPGEADFSDDYWPEDRPVLERPADTVGLLQSLTGRARAAALRSLRGSTLRTELYALDGSDRQDRPFTVTEAQYGLREEDRLEDGSQRQRIFFPHPVAQRTTQWERGTEPMSRFAFAGDYDRHGNARSKVEIAVPRRRDFRKASAEPGEPYLASLTLTDYAQRDTERAYLVDRVARVTSLEIINDGRASLFDLHRAITNGSAPRRLIGQVLNAYDGPAFIGGPPGEPGDFGALVRTERLIVTEELLREVHGDVPPYLVPDGAPPGPEYPAEFVESLPPLAGYVFHPGGDGRERGYFAVTACRSYDFQNDPPGRGRGLVLAERNPMGQKTRISYDAFDLLPTAVTDPVGLSLQVENDYRVVQPRMTTDANGNRRAVIFSPLGMVTATAVMGKAGDQAGDTLEAPSTRLEYDFFAFENRRQPAFVRSIVRQHHVTETDVQQERDETIQIVEYSDGFGRLLQTRTQAEDVLFGPSFGGGVLSPDQSVATGDALGRPRAPGDLPNVVVSGWQRYDNKGRVIERYEPFFATGLDYAAPGDTQLGQNATMFYDPRGQLIRTLNPDGSEQRVIYGIPADLSNPDQFAPTPWEAYTYDANDLAPLCEGPDGAPLAGAAPTTHHFTASSNVVDALGRTIESVARNGLDPADWFRTRSSYDIRGNVLTVTDALNRVAFRYAYDLANRPWRIESVDAGLRQMVLNASGNETERRDNKGALILQGYDRLQRPIRLWARDAAGSPITLRQRMEYGDAGIPDQAASERVAMRERNMLGQVHRNHDEAGLTTIAALDFKGNVLDKSRRVIADGPILAVFERAPANAWRVTPFRVDWEPRPQQTLAERESELLERTTYQTTASYDALNRVKRMRLPQDVEGRRRELRPEYNRAGGLEQVRLDDTLYVERIAYDAKGQRALIAYGNGVMTRYAHDPHTFRLKRLRSERYTKPDDLSYRPGGEAVQDFGYDYDLAGNIVRIRDRAPGAGIPNNPDALTAADPTLPHLLGSGDALNRRFGYDPIYRLLSATGRECDRPPESEPWEDVLRCTDLTKTRAYTERYRYDAMGNMLRLEHRNGNGGFTRHFTVETANNRLREMKVANSAFAYAFDANGNMRSETSSRHFEWSHSDQLIVFRTQTEGAEPSIHAHYLYDAARQRVKKLVRKQGGGVEVTHYIDAVFEHHRWDGPSQAGENNHVHVLDDRQRIALVRLGAAHQDDRGPAVQFHLGDHLGSSNVVVDLGGTLVNREEFTPYGETSFGSFGKKRYRFTGQERDEESGLIYHGVRYYAAHAGRWLACDPLHLTYACRVDRAKSDLSPADETGGATGRSSSPTSGRLLAVRMQNLYHYGFDNPMAFADTDGWDPVRAVGETVDILHKGYDVYEASHATNPMAGMMYVTALFLPFGPAILLSGFASGLEAASEGNERRREAERRHQEERVRRLDDHVRDAIANRAIDTGATAVIYSPTQAQRIGSLIQTIRDLDYWADLVLFPERVGHIEYERIPALPESASRLEPYLVDPGGQRLQLFPKAAQEYEKVLNAFNELDAELSGGEVETSVSGLPRSEPPPSFVEVRGLSYDVDPVSLEAKPRSFFIDLHSLQDVYPRTERE